MKKIITMIVLPVMMILSGCDDKLDIVPKGMTTLDNVEDLETLLEDRFMLEGTVLYETLCGNCYPEINTKPELTLADKTTLEYCMLAADEKVDRVALADYDYGYLELYRIINVANVIISKAPECAGADDVKRRIIAEARILRAWYHFIAVNLYAAQYDASTASTLGGVALSTNSNVQEQKVKRTIQEVYDFILDDCSDAVISDLRQEAVNNPFRFGAEFGNAVRASVLFQMKRYAEALPYAQKAVSFNSTLEDRTTVISNKAWTLDWTSPNNYFMIYHDMSNIGEWGRLVCTPDFASALEPEDVLIQLGYTNRGGWTDPTNYGPEGSLRFKSSDVHYNSWGIRTENMYYLIAECLIRDGKYRDGLRYVDEVRNKRFVPNSDIYFDRDDITREAQAMEILQRNKRQEMFTTIYNYLDRKRWNTENAYKRAVTHDCGEGVVFSVQPESPLWINPFPKTATNYNNTLTQNF